MRIKALQVHSIGWAYWPCSVFYNLTQSWGDWGGGWTLRRTQPGRIGVQILFPLCKTAIENEHIDKVMVVGANRKGCEVLGPQI